VSKFEEIESSAVTNVILYFAYDVFEDIKMVLNVFDMPIYFGKAPRFLDM
jgi:hypothetical protein